ncbi:uncharacterized protein N7459_006802 [Penicillium hispanicum]|uniref:uncharacterized protein n=1 Tax=Penicillium hispanicum TaxID=1080232 RepID=UPI002541F48C|nr:uncharacterized protein N7459_006802 [Penicillium hispanicum]KAJ5577838.1 hypothetical protein N7459_006802 [Penicillium hispanicum]
MLPLRLRRTLSSRPRNVADESQDVPADVTASKGETEGELPGLWDVLKVRYLLQWKVRDGLPTELVDAIIDAAEYWPSMECHMDGDERVIGKDRDQTLMKTVPLCYERQASLSASLYLGIFQLIESGFLLEGPVSPRPLPHRTAHPCRKIVFQLSSHDQGFGRFRDNMYECSWTWFDTEVIRGAHTRNMYVDGVEQEILDNEKGRVKKNYTPADELLLPRDNKLQVNGARVAEMQDRVITWHYLDNIAPESEKAYHIERTQGRGRLTLDGRGVRELEVGDSIALWARARFPGWANHVSQASIRIFWAV